MKTTSPIKIFAVLLFAAAIISSCKKKETTAQLTLQMSKKEVSVANKTGNSLQFTSGHVIITEIGFDGDRKDKEDVSITHEQIAIIDLATGLSDPEVVINIPAGIYEEVELEIEILDDDDIHPLAVLAEGIFTDANGNEVPVRFEFNSGETFEAESDSTVEIAPDTDPFIKVSFDPADWFATVTAAQLNGAERDVNGVIVISEDVNSAIFEIVADRMDDLTDAEF